MTLLICPLTSVLFVSVSALRPYRLSAPDVLDALTLPHRGDGLGVTRAVVLGALQSMPPGAGLLLVPAHGPWPVTRDGVGSALRLFSSCRHRRWFGHRPSPSKLRSLASARRDRDMPFSPVRTRAALAPAFARRAALIWIGGPLL